MLHCMGMSRYRYLESDSSLRATLDRRNADDLKRLSALLPGGSGKVTRKVEVVEMLVRFLLGDGLSQLWTKLSALEQSAVAEAVHGDGIFDSSAFLAKYGELPAFETDGEHRWSSKPTLLRLFIHDDVMGGHSVPDDLREKLRAFVPEPEPAKLGTLEQIPEQRPREGTSQRDANDTTADTGHELRLTVRLTEQAAVQDLRTVLRLIDQQKISVSSKTLLPSKATMGLLDDLLRDRDFFELSEKLNSWDPEIGPVKAFSWPLLVQAAKLAALRNEKLALTKAGRAGLDAPPAHTLRDVWNAWGTRGIIDEFSRIDVIKGQKGKGSKALTPPESRRLAIKCALAECPVGRWVEFGEFSRYMQAAGFQFAVTHDHCILYICDPQYGHLGYQGFGGWNIVEERYLLCLLFEYAAPLGIIDIAYEHPAGARDDYHENWGTDELIFLSRYDGLRYFRVTPLGAFILGQTDHYEARPEELAVSLTVLPNRQIRVDRGELAPDQKLLLESFAQPQSPGLWILDEARVIQSVERGARIAELRSFLAAGDPQPLPEVIEGFLAGLEQRSSACLCKGTALLIECISPEVAEQIAHHLQTAKLCQRTGERGLVVPLEKEKSFRDALKAIGYGMPQV